MKKYKVIFQYKDGEYSGKYFDTKQQADEFAIGDNIKNVTLPKQVNVELHHRASRRGYICKGCGREEFYSGHFGEGFIKHIENVADSPHGSNNYHFIEYWLETK